LNGAAIVDVLIATGNPGKAKEFQEMLGDGDGHIRWRSLAEFPNVDSVEETGGTFRANAALKAAGYARATGLWALADDSGLEVDALAGKPGVHSARWAEMHARGKGDAANNALLIEQIRDVPDARRSARFVCVLALADPSGRIILSARDTIEGRMLHAPVGSNGFGYDPLFYVDALGQTTAQLPAEQKHQVSHRGRALRRMRALLQRTRATG
jgi:XTP/dITP diphosphohydrolase